MVYIMSDGITMPTVLSGMMFLNISCSVHTHMCSFRRLAPIIRNILGGIARIHLFCDAVCMLYSIDIGGLDVATSQACVPRKSFRQVPALARTCRNLFLEPIIKNNDQHSINSETVSVLPVYNTTIFFK